MTQQFILWRHSIERDDAIELGAGEEADLCNDGESQKGFHQFVDPSLRSLTTQS